MNWLTILKEIITISGTLAALGIAFIGLRSWQKELKGRAYFEIARNLIKVIYETRDALLFDCRIRKFELDHIYDDIYQNKLSIYDSYSAFTSFYDQKWIPVEKLIQKLSTILFEAEILWGKEPLVNIYRLQKMSSVLRIAFLDDAQNRTFDDHPDNDIKTNIILFSLEKDDQFSESIKTCITEIEDHIKPFLKGKRVKRNKYYWGPKPPKKEK